MCPQESFFAVLAVPVCRLLFVRLLFHSPNAWTTKQYPFPWGWSPCNPTTTRVIAACAAVVYTKQRRAVWPLVSVLHLICRCVRRSWSRTSGSARSSTRQTCIRTSPRAWQRGCCTRAHSRGGCSRRVRPRCGYIPFPESQGSPIFGLRHSNWAICSHTAGLLSRLVFFAGFFLSCVAFFSVCLIFVCCFHTYLSDSGQSFQRRTLFSSKFSQHRTQKHRDNGNPLTSALLQPESKERMTYGRGLSFIRNTAWHQLHRGLEVFNITAPIGAISVMGKPECRRIHVRNQVSNSGPPLWEAWSSEWLCVCTLQWR